MLVSAQNLLVTFGVIGIGVVMLFETGLLLGLVLPGETLTILAGAYSHGNAAGHPHPQLSLVIIAAATGAIAGGQLGYVLGRKLGPQLLDRPDGRLFKRRYVQRTREHFARFGSTTIVIARFIPFVRTIVSPAAGVGAMPARRFALYNAGGGLLWAVCVTLLGYVIGGLISVDRYAVLLTIGIVLVSLSPLVIHRLATRSP